MNSVGIDTFLKATQEAPKAKPLASASGSGEFNDYLREAANAQPQPAKEQPATKPKATEAPAQSKSEEKDSTKSSGEQAKSSVESTEQVDQVQDGAVEEEQTTEAESDEVLLSVAAIAASSPEDVTLVETPDVNLEVAADTANAEAAQPSQETATGPDFMPDLEQALAEGEPAVEGESSLPAIDADAVELAKSEVAAEAPTPIVAQVAAQQQGEQQAAQANAGKEEQAQVPAGAPESIAAIQNSAESVVKSESDTKEVDKPEPKAEKTTAVDKSGIAEQLATQVAAAVAESDSTHETKHKATADTASTAPSIQGDSQAQSLTRDASRADAQMMQSDGDPRMPTVDRTRFVQRVANAFRSAQQNDGQIQMRLSPPELGSLRIEIAVRNGVLTANLETETADARRVLLDNLPALRQRLAEQDIRIEKFDVDVRREGSQSDGQAGAQDRQAQQQSQRAAAQNRIRSTTPANVISARVPRPHITSADGGLDVRI